MYTKGSKIHVPTIFYNFFEYFLTFSNCDTRVRLPFIKPPLEKMLFPVQRPGESVRADWDLFFHFQQFFFSILFFTIFLQTTKKKRKKKDFVAA